MDLLKFAICCFAIYTLGEMAEMVFERETEMRVSECAAWNYQLKNAPTPDIYSTRPLGCIPLTVAPPTSAPLASNP